MLHIPVGMAIDEFSFLCCLAFCVFGCVKMRCNRVFFFISLVVGTTHAFPGSIPVEGMLYKLVDSVQTFNIDFSIHHLTFQLFCV